MSQIRQNVALYNRVELLLKKAAREGHALPASEITKLVGDVAKDGKQVLNVIQILYNKGLLLRTDYKVPGTRERYRYAWDPVMMEEGYAAKPQTPTPASKSTPAKQVMVAKPADEIEIQFGGVSIVVGKNPMTGRIKVVIEG